jgi:hypothetical protein
MDYERLKERHRAERGPWHPNLSRRVHRALSWLDRAEQLAAEEDTDGRTHPGAAFPRSDRIVWDKLGRRVERAG